MVSAIMKTAIIPKAGALLSVKRVHHVARLPDPPDAGEAEEGGQGKGLSPVIGQGQVSDLP